MSCWSLRLLSNPATLFHFVQAVWEKFDCSLSGSIRLIQRKLTLIDSNLRRHCLIRKILSSKCVFRWREFPRCHSRSPPVEGKVRQHQPWQREPMAAPLQLGLLLLEVLSTALQEVIPQEIMSFPPREKTTKPPRSSAISSCLPISQMLVWNFTELWDWD